MRAQIVFLACVAILGCQAAPQPKTDEIDVDQIIQAVIAFLENVDIEELLDRIPDDVNVDQIIQAVIDFLENVDIEELLDRIPDEETRQRVIEAIEALRELAANIEDHRETIDCVTGVVESARYPPIGDIRIIATEGANLVRLLVQRSEEIAACEAIGGDNPSALDLARIRVCLAGVEATTGVQVALSTFRIRQAANRLRELEGDIRVCVDHLIPE